jgi:hypothetical protein
VFAIKNTIIEIGHLYSGTRYISDQVSYYHPSVFPIVNTEAFCLGDTFGYVYAWLRTSQMVCFFNVVLSFTACIYRRFWSTLKCETGRLLC